MDAILGILQAVLQTILQVPGWLIGMVVSLAIATASFVAANWWQSVIGLAVFGLIYRRIREWWVRGDFYAVFGEYPCAEDEAGFVVLQGLVRQELLSRACRFKDRENVLNVTLRAYELGTARVSREDYARVQALSFEIRGLQEAFEQAKRLATHYGFQVATTEDYTLGRKIEERQRAAEAANTRPMPTSELPPSRARSS